MSVSVQIENTIELRKAGIRALNAALGYDGAQTFLKQFTGSGDFTKERHEISDRSLDEIFADIVKLQEENADLIAVTNARGRGDFTVEKKLRPKWTDADYDAHMAEIIEDAKTTARRATQ